MKNPILYRKRLIPNECILLKNDSIRFCDENVIITEWKALKPRKDLHHGYSCYFLKEGYKVSKFYREDDSLLYWYCDIVDYNYVEKDNTLIVTDLLVDVIQYPDGFIKVVDIDEIVTALNENLIDVSVTKTALLRLNNLLEIMYCGDFAKLQNYIHDIENKQY